MADILHRYGPEYLRYNGDRVLPSHRKAIRDITRCRTIDMRAGGLYRCDDCHRFHYAYRSCGNRHCPRCGNDKVDQWLQKQQELLLPVDYFLVTFTLPQELRAIAYTHQRDVYNAMFTASSAALKELAADRRFLGAKIGMLGVLQTWQRNLDYHPHIHYLVPGGGLSADNRRWLYPKKRDFLVAQWPLGDLFRGKFKDQLEQLGFRGELPAGIWRQQWIVDCTPVGDGRRALRYLGPYVHRVALSDRRITTLRNDRVSFRYTPSGTTRSKLRTLPAFVFIALFLKHILPKGFMKIRYYGLLASPSRTTLRTIRLAILTCRSQPPQPPPKQQRIARCPHCGGPMQCIGFFERQRGPP